jgi:hypothetical protein
MTPAEDVRMIAKNRPTDRKLSKALRRSVQQIQMWGFVCGILKGTFTTPMR